jgi:hypothetical protein
MIFRYRPQLASIDQLAPGDIVGYSGDHWLSWIINIATYGVPWWGLSHIGIVGEYTFPGKTDPELLLFESTESTSDLPCAINGKPFRGSQAFHIGPRLQEYRGKVWHYPLYRPLYDFERVRLNKFLLDTLHTPYDEMGAFRSAGVGLSWIEGLLREQDLTSIFCSEMVMAAYSVVGLCATDNVSRWSPNRLVRHLRHHEILRKRRRLK